MSWSWDLEMSEGRSDERGKKLVEIAVQMVPGSELARMGKIEYSKATNNHLLAEGNVRRKKSSLIVHRAYRECHSLSC